MQTKKRYKGNTFPETKFLKFLIFTLALACCQNSENNITEAGFRKLMNNIAEGWSTQNTNKALSSFHKDAIYMEPPNIQYYRGHKELKPYFYELDNKYKMEFHNLWFDQSTQSGAGEYTFSYGKDTSDVGIVVVEIERGKVKFWREYQRKGPTNCEDFLRIENKEWKWHIGNYPAPKDTANIQ